MTEQHAPEFIYGGTRKPERTNELLKLITRPPMSISDKLEFLLAYYHSRRCVGHTYTMLRGALNNPLAIVITGTFDQTRLLKNVLPENNVIAWSRVESIIGRNNPIVFDNSGIVELLRETLTYINQLEQDYANEKKRSSIAERAYRDLQSKTRKQPKGKKTKSPIR